ncbi:sugar transferase [Methylobacterium sp. J-072]|uniref:sugar transferase n=1 Tax=Methylobacterium sp. J-072 TaxID=2836651 RepID=UPI001FB8B2E4|nr:sugar transferase [Methylobacterium sp. J-072]MCJ2092100.1 sugar transferase [Methylobacterium sp. J-072]
MAVVVSLVISVAGRVLADEFKAFRPMIVDRLVARAVRKMPAELQERYAEEWRSHLEEIPGDIAKVWTAFGYNLVAGRIASSFFSWEITAKRALDVVLGGTAIFLLFPLLLTIAASIWIEDRRAPMFMHSRIGKDGRRFSCFKFRTMRVDGNAILAAHLAANPVARAEWMATYRLKDDPRITAIGKLLRKTSLDELPQFINVWRGEMSMVGPRPIVEEEIQRYGVNFSTCFSVKPGLFGLWQVKGTSNMSYEERVDLDLEYVRNWSIRSDIKILLRTVPDILSQREYR